MASAFAAGIFSLTTKGFLVINLFKSTSPKFFISRLKSPSVNIPAINLFFKITMIPNFFLLIILTASLNFFCNLLSAYLFR